MLRLRLSILLVLCTPLFALAQEDESAKRLEEIELQVHEESLHLEELNVRSASLEKELKTLQSGVDKIRSQSGKIQGDLQNFASERSQLDRELVSIDKKTKDIWSLMKKRVRALYVTRSDSVTAQLFLSSDSTALERNAYFLVKMKRFDQELIAQLDTLYKSAQEKRGRVDQVMNEQQKLRDKLEKDQKQLQGKLKDMQAVSKSLKVEKNRREETVAALRAQALRLETVIKGLTGADEGSTSTAKLKEDQEQEKQVIDAHFEGSGLSKQKAKLVRPVTGKTLQKYGKVKHAEFEDFIFNKGLEFQSEPGSKAVAIAQGRVIFVGRMPGYGTIVILDHGQRDYSLYGRLEETLVTKGNVLEQGTALGKLGEKDEKGRNFYFEIRHNGSPVDPGKFIRNL